MANGEVIRIEPNAQYAISGAAMLSIADVLQGNIPCRYSDTVERALSLLGSAKQLPAKSDTYPAPVLPTSEKQLAPER